MKNADLLRKLGFDIDTNYKGVYTVTHKSIGEQFRLDPSDSCDDFEGFIKKIIPLVYEKGKFFGDIEAKNKIRDALGIDDGYYNK